MARTDEAEAFFFAVYSAIQEIPHGKVTSYGHIARLIGTQSTGPSSLRLVTSEIGYDYIEVGANLEIAGSMFLVGECSAALQPIYRQYTSLTLPFIIRIHSNYDVPTRLVEADNTYPTAQRPRQVGVCLKHLSSDPTSRFHNGNVPWQRVINSRGIISPRGHPSGATHQAQVLRSEGVTVNTGSLGELMVDLGEYGWFPKQLPSEVAAGVAYDGSESEGEDEA